MKTYFDQGNFEPFVYRRLNEVIDKHRNNPDSYAVFDFDNTSIIMDIEDNLNIYLIEHLDYKLSPKELHEILTEDYFKEQLSQSFDPNNPQATGLKLADDIVDSYRWLYEHYIKNPNKSKALLEEIKASPHYTTFAAKLRYYHTFVNTHFLRVPSKTWLTYLFAGHTVEEFKDIAENCIRESIQKPFERVTFESSKELPGKSGVITAQFNSGLIVPPELLNLFEAFRDNGIKSYIISASPRIFVEVASQFFGHAVDNADIIAMEFETDDNVILPIMKDKHPITKGRGKTDAIREIVMPRHNGKEPIAMFGDSIGDYDMMTIFTHADLNVLFNRHMTDDFGKLIQKAIDQYGDDDAQFVLQGRDENKGILLKSQASVAFGDTEARI